MLPAPGALWRDGVSISNADRETPYYCTTSCGGCPVPGDLSIAESVWHYSINVGASLRLPGNPAQTKTFGLVPLHMFFLIFFRCIFIANLWGYRTKV